MGKVAATTSSNQSTLNFDEIVSSLLLEEMRQKTIDTHSMDSLSVRGFHQERNKNKGSQGIYKSKGGYKSLGKGIRKSWKWGKSRHYKNDCRSKNVEKEKGSDDTPSTEENNF